MAYRRSRKLTIIIFNRPISFRQSSRLPRLKKSSPFGQLCLLRHGPPTIDHPTFKGNAEGIYADYNLIGMAQALEGKDVKDLLLNVGSGGGAAPAAAPAGGAGGAAGSAPEAAKEEEKPEEKEVSYMRACMRSYVVINISYRSPTRTWASDCSTKQPKYFCTTFRFFYSTISFLYLFDIRAIKFSRAWVTLGLVT